MMPLVLPGMYKRKWGRLIGLGLHPTKLPPAYAYNVGKAARNDALLLAADAAWSHGVTVNVVCPGPVEEVPDLELAVELCDHGDSWASRANVTPQDIAEGVAMLCSEAGRFVTGCRLPYAFK
jgi:NAD(P)-dependent dehydrogenase (short-subunit alcohol dehydrogenase family)